jgi:murein DD-endopeptidase MepM/ murein hydrolase activator NlpD
LKVKKKKVKPFFIGVLCLLVLVPAAWLLIVRFESEKPSVALDLPFPSIGVSKELPITISDQKSGVRKIWIGLLTDGKETVLLEKSFPAGDFLRGGKVRQESFKVPVEPGKIGIAEGKAVLRLIVSDYSWRGWWRGNKTYLEKEVIIDTRPPVVDVLSRHHNVSQGGTGLVIYKISEPCPESGVYVGKNFFPGYSGHFTDKNIFMAFMALDYRLGPETEIFVKATDQAGNSTRAGFPYYIKRKNFKKDTLNIADNFLKWKMPEFEREFVQDHQKTLLDKFLYVNRNIRQANYKTFQDLFQQCTPELYWKGVFLRLPNSAKRAGFADHREYKYKGRVIDHQVHLGQDLASVSHAPVPAANSGKVVSTDTLGIYGRTVAIDHGFGLFSIYAHLSAIEVKAGQMVSKGDIIGRTGSTGLAGGDHLHFGMCVHNTFVNPLEWWDASWITNNITDKIKLAASL